MAKDPESKVHSKVASSQPRGEHGQFISFKENIKKPSAYTPDDPPLINVQVTNPITYLKLWLNKILKNEGIELRLRIRPLTAVAIFLLVTLGSGLTGFQVARVFFPTSSPLLKREINYNGTLKNTGGEYYLVISPTEMYRLDYKSLDELNGLENQNVFVKGNLGREKNVIKVQSISAF